MTTSVPHTGATSVIDFDGLSIRYDDTVLAPRPWTMAQSHWAAELIRDSAPDGPVLELCAGVGHIGLLAVARAPRRYVAVDASETACAFLRDNAAAAGVSVDVRCADLASALEPDERFAVVIADPPWVPTDQTQQFPEDPLVAIDGGEDGLRGVRLCLAVIDAHLASGGSAILQVGPEDQAEQVADLVAGTGRLRVVDVRSFERGALVRLDRSGDGAANGSGTVLGR